MTLEGINWLAVIVSGVLYFVVGAVWYSPVLFANQFIKYRGVKPEEIQGQPTDYLFTFIGDIFMAVVFGVIINSLGITRLVDGILTGVVLAWGIAATTSFVYTVFSGPHKGLWVIYSGYMTVGFALMGAILALWQ